MLVTGRMGNRFFLGKVYYVPVSHIGWCADYFF